MQGNPLADAEIVALDLPSFAALRSFHILAVVADFALVVFWARAEIGAVISRTAMAGEDQNEGGEETVLWARERVSLKAHSNNVTCAGFLRNQDVACTGSQDGTVMMWSVKQGWTHRLRAHTGWVTCLAVQLQGALMASGSADETVRLWHLPAVLEAAGDSQVPCPQSASPAATEMSVVLKNYGGCVKCCAFNKSGSLLACGSADNLVLLIVLPRCICRRV